MDAANHRRLREDRAVRASFMGVTFQGVYALAQFVVLALMIRYVGRERVGMWITVSSMAAWMGLLTLGLQFVLLTTLGGKALTDPDGARRTFTTVAVAVAVVGLASATLCAVIGPFLPWPRLLNVDDATAIREAMPLGTVVLFLSALASPALLGGHALQASQRGDLNHLCSLVVWIATAISVYLGVRAGVALPVLGAMLAAAPLVAGLAHWTVGLRLRILPRVSLSAFDGQLLRTLARSGVVFLLLDVLTVALLQSGPLLLTHARNPEAVVPYAAAARLAGLPISAFTMIGFAYWPAYSEAAQRRDYTWMRRGITRSLVKVLGLWLLAAAAILLAGGPFVAWWLGPAVRPSPALLFASALFALSYGVYVTLTAPLSGMGHLRDQLTGASAMLVVYLVAGVALCARHGATGLVLGQAFGALVGAGVNASLLRRRLRGFSTEAVP